MKSKLFMILLGCKPKGRLTEQHDIFFGIASTIKELIPEINKFWPEAEGKIHIDAWREVTCVDTNKITTCQRNFDLDMRESQAINKLFFVNLGGYKKDVFDEFHYKMLIVAKDTSEAISKAKETTFFKHTGFTGAASHVDDKYGIDVDDIYQIEDLLSKETKKLYKLVINNNVSVSPNEIHLGYQKLSKFE
jgi:hypothetical protein